MKMRAEFLILTFSHCRTSKLHASLEMPGPGPCTHQRACACVCDHLTQEKILMRSIVKAISCPIYFPFFGPPGAPTRPQEFLFLRETLGPGARGRGPGEKKLMSTPRPCGQGGVIRRQPIAERTMLNTNLRAISFWMLLHVKCRSHASG